MTYTIECVVNLGRAYSKGCEIFSQILSKISWASS